VLLAVVEELQNIVANDDARLATQNIQGTHPCASRSESDGFVGITVECLYEFLRECLHEYAEDGCQLSVEEESFQLRMRRGCFLWKPPARAVGSRR
jgi:hypothetical protein